jgi:hypothetical protein
LPSSDDSLQLPSITQRILNSHLAQLLLITRLIDIRLQALVREVYPAVLDEPAARLGEGDDGAFGVQEEEVLGGGDWEGGVSCFAAAGDFGADLGG